MNIPLSWCRRDAMQGCSRGFEQHAASLRNGLRVANADAPCKGDERRVAVHTSEEQRGSALVCAMRMWQDVLRLTLTQISLLGDDVFDDIVNDFPRYVNRKNAEMRKPRTLDSAEWHVETK